MEQNQYQDDTISREQETRELLSLFDWAKEYRSQFEEEAKSCYIDYVGYRKAIEGRSNLHIPRSYELLDTLRAQLVQAITQNRPYVEFVPIYKRPEDLQQTEQLDKKAELAAGIVDNQLEKNEFELKVYDFVTDFLIAPASFMSVGWRQEVRMIKKKIEKTVSMLENFVNTVLQREAQTFDIVDEQETIWDDNELQIIDFFDFWPDPRATECNIDKCRFVFVREWMTWDNIQDYLMLLREHADGTVYDLNQEDIDQNGSYDDTAEEIRRGSIGGNFDDRDGSDDMDSDRLKLYEVLHYWEDGKHAILVNRYSLAYSGGNPYWRHSKIPIVAACYEPLRGQFYGQSAIQRLKHLQAELDTTRNQRIDNVSMIINRMWLRIDPNIPDSALVSKPNNIIDSAVPDGIKSLDTPDVTSSAYQEEAIIKQDMEGALPTPPITRGQGQEQRATNAMINNQNATTRYSVKLTLFERMGLKRIAYLMDMNNQQFIEEPRLAKFADQDGAFAWRMVDPGDTYGEHDYRPASASIDPALSKDIKRQQAIQLFPLAMENKFTDQYKFTKLLYKLFDKDFTECLKSQEQVRSEEQQAQMMATMQMQQQEQAMQQQGQQQAEDHQMNMIDRGIGMVQKVGQLMQPQEEPNGRSKSTANENNRRL